MKKEIVLKEFGANPKLCRNRQSRKTNNQIVRADMKERLALDLYNWRGKTSQQIESDFSSYLIENKHAPLDEKVTYYELTVKNGRLLSEEFGFVTDLIVVNNQQDQLELEATKEIEKWAQSRDNKTAIWISPPSDSYSESRFVIFDKKNDQIVCRAICGKESGAECLDIANKLGSTYETTDQLRSGIVDIKGENWIETLEDVIGESRVWERIKKGQDIEEKHVTTKIASEIVTKYSLELKRIDNYYRQILLGAIIEQEAKNYGYHISHQGSCGISNIAALGNLSEQNLTPFDNFFKGSWNQEKYFSCPRCQGKIPSGFGITTCPHCGAKKENYKSCD